MRRPVRTSDPASAELIDAVLPTLADLRSLRAQAYVILAWGHLWMAGVKDLGPLDVFMETAQIKGSEGGFPVSSRARAWATAGMLP